MPVRCRRCAICRVPGAAVHRWHCRFMVEMGLCACAVGVRSYRFGSGLLGLVRVLQRSQCHVVGHCVARLAAQKQQGEHEDEEQGAHG